MPAKAPRSSVVRVTTDVDVDVHLDEIDATDLCAFVAADPDLVEGVIENLDPVGRRAASLDLVYGLAEDNERARDEIILDLLPDALGDPVHGPALWGRIVEAAKAKGHGA